MKNIFACERLEFMVGEFLPAKQGNSVFGEDAGGNHTGVFQDL